MDCKIKINKSQISISCGFSIQFISIEPIQNKTHHCTKRTILKPIKSFIAIGSQHVDEPCWILISHNLPSHHHVWWKKNKALKLWCLDTSQHFYKYLYKMPCYWRPERKTLKMCKSTVLQLVGWSPPHPWWLPIDGAILQHVTSYPLPFKLTLLHWNINFTCTNY